MSEIREEKLNKWLRSEVAVAFAIGSAVVAIISYFMNPVRTLETGMAVLQTQVTNIKNNDLVHIFESQTKTETTIEAIQAQQIKNTVQLQQILDILKK